MENLSKWKGHCPKQPHGNLFRHLNNRSNGQGFKLYHINVVSFRIFKVNELLN